MVPLSGLSRLSKGFIEISGIDSAKFLNGLVTTRFLPNIIKKNQYTISDVEFKHVNLNKIIDLHENWGVMHEDMYDPNNEILIRRDGVNSMFLNSKGRVITDSFLYPTPFQIGLSDSHQQKQQLLPSYLIEVDKSILTKLTMLLKMHKLMSDITFDVKDYHSYYYYSDSLEFDTFLETLQDTYFNTYTPRDASVNSNKFVNEGAVLNKDKASSLIGFAIDNRIPNFGLKFTTDKPIDESFFSDKFKENFGVQEVSESHVITRRFLNGLYESRDSPPNFQLLPFDMNLDYINGLSLDKGCYVGQELTIRTYNSGVIRKRIVPFQFFDLEDLKSADVASDELQLVSDSPISQILSKINHEDLDKLKVSLLKEEEPQPTTSPAASSPFGNSGKPVKSRRPNVGKILAIDSNLGFMLVNLHEIDKRLFKVEIPGLEKPLGIKISKPNWWPEEEDLED